MRLDKYLSEMGIASRSELKKAIKKGSVTINGAVETDPAKHVDPAWEICFQGVPVAYEKHQYYMLHKPAGVITANEDARHGTVMDLLKDAQGKGLFPVGRLDKDTEGLILITNDGPLAHHLLSPRHHVKKTYYAKIQGQVTEEDVGRFREGLRIDADWTALPAGLHILSVELVADAPKTPPAPKRLGWISEIEVTITEGKYHQVKRMFQAVDKEVLYLKRLSMGPLTLDEKLPVGAYRVLTDEEIQALAEC